VLKGSFFSILPVFAVVPRKPVVRIALQVTARQQLATKEAGDGKMPDFASRRAAVCHCFAEAVLFAEITTSLRRSAS
jgi:hypothetical protein